MRATGRLARGHMPVSHSSNSAQKRTAGQLNGDSLDRANNLSINALPTEGLRCCRTPLR
jgi:hypothetical protein